MEIQKMSTGVKCNIITHIKIFHSWKEAFRFYTSGTLEKRSLKKKNRKLDIFVKILCFMSNSRGKLSLFSNTNTLQNLII